MLSYALHLGEEIRARGLDPAKDLKIKIGLFGGEGMTEPMRDEMKKMSLPEPEFETLRGTFKVTFRFRMRLQRA